MTGHREDAPTTPAADERPAGSDAPGRPVPALSLGDPLTARAVEDRPEAWGERGESDEDREARYLIDRPPHHGT